MKLLGWMHRKLRHNTSETTPKDFPIDDMLHCYQKGNHGSKPPFGKAQRGNYYRNSFTSLESAMIEHEDDPEDDITDLFHGFLAIGTLGTEQFTTDPLTPTFSISVDHIAEKETQVTEIELKLINDELEKVLGDDVSSGRNSQVSAGRISYCSAITLSGKPNIESADTCPLQSYLFGSAIGVADAAPPQAKKEQRTSLGDLFQKTKQADQENCCVTNKIKETEKSAVHVMKKMLKKTINVHASVSKSSTPIDSTTAEKKLHNKILQMFNRKVHPENPTTACHKPTKNNANSVGSDSGSSTEDIIIYPQQPDISKETRCCKSQSLNKNNGDATTGNHEFWVKTDADYLVLEL